MTRRDPQKKVDAIRALILADIIRKNYLEELLENSKSKKDKVSKKRR
jgi:hypothetical protein